MMILIDNIVTQGWEAAIRGMRNPMNSWDKSDSEYKGFCTCPSPGQKYCDYCGYDACSTPYDGEFVVGENDLTLMKQLIKAGSDHSKFMRMINVTMDITAPLYWWKEFDTYKVGTVRNSCSTMHKIHAKKFEVEDFSCDHLETFKETLDNGETIMYQTENWLKTIINQLNWARDRFIKTNDKKYWWIMIQLLPSSYMQKATVQMNYAVLRNMYRSRKNHKLDEWRTFCDMMKGELYYSSLITEDFE